MRRFIIWKFILILIVFIVGFFVLSGTLNTHPVVKNQTNISSSGFWIIPGLLYMNSYKSTSTSGSDSDSDGSGSSDDDGDSDSGDGFSGGDGGDGGGE